MIKFIFYTRVFFISYEFLFILLGLAVYVNFENFMIVRFSDVSFNAKALEWVMLFPISVFVWTMKESRSVIFPDNYAAKVIHEWPGYWKLRAHFDVGIFNNIIYIIPCLLVWIFDGLLMFEGAFVFFVFASALTINAFTFYLAKVNVSSALIKVDNK